jgi:hypothetical protein
MTVSKAASQRLSFFKCRSGHIVFLSRLFVKEAGLAHFVFFLDDGLANSHYIPKAARTLRKI